MGARRSPPQRHRMEGAHCTHAARLGTRVAQTGRATQMEVIQPHDPASDDCAVSNPNRLGVRDGIRNSDEERAPKTRPLSVLVLTSPAR